MKKQVMTQQVQNVLPDCLDVWSTKRIKEEGADAVKFLLYYDVDSSRRTQPRKTSLHRTHRF